MLDILNNIKNIKQKVAVAAEKSGRSLDDITIVAVTKYVSFHDVVIAANAGISHFGENTAQELGRKYDEINLGVKWHFIGHLQSNKVKHIIDKVSLIHSLDRLSLAKELDKRARESGSAVDVLIQVNVAEEDSKYGLKMEEVEPFIQKISEAEFIRVRGLMTMAPYADDSEKARPYFKELKRLKDILEEKEMGNADMDFLSMGMTNDYVVGIEEGANIVRIGRAIFNS